MLELTDNVANELKWEILTLHHLKETSRQSDLGLMEETFSRLKVLPKKRKEFI